MDELKVIDWVIHTAIYENGVCIIRVDLRKSDGDWVENFLHIKDEKIIKFESYYPESNEEVKVRAFIEKRCKRDFFNDIKDMEVLIQTPLEEIKVEKVVEGLNIVRVVFFKNNENQKYELKISKASGKKTVQKFGPYYLDFGYGYGSDLMNHVLKNSSYRVKALVNGYLEMN